MVKAAYPLCTKTYQPVQRQLSRNYYFLRVDKNGSSEVLDKFEVLEDMQLATSVAEKS